MLTKYQAHTSHKQFYSHKLSSTLPAQTVLHLYIFTISNTHLSPL